MLAAIVSILTTVSLLLLLACLHLLDENKRRKTEIQALWRALMNSQSRHPLPKQAMEEDW